MTSSHTTPCKSPHIQSDEVAKTDPASVRANVDRASAVRTAELDDESIKDSDVYRELEERYKKLKDEQQSLKPIPKLGVLRLDYDYPPALGDVAHPMSYRYPVVFKVCPGLTFEICQTGNIPDQVAEDVLKSVKYLEDQGCGGIIGDCGFMLHLQRMVRESTLLPVCLSSVMLLPSIGAFYGFCLPRKEAFLDAGHPMLEPKIAIITSNSKMLLPMYSLIQRECSVNPDNTRFLITGVQRLPGMQAVGQGKHVDTKVVEANMVSKCLQMVDDDPTLMGFLFECTELGPYSDAVRCATGLPVWDAITAADFLMSGVLEHPSFGKKWQDPFSQTNDASYEFASELSEDELERLRSPTPRSRKKKDGLAKTTVQ